MGRAQIIGWLLCGVWLGGPAFIGYAQPGPSAPQADALMQLMLSQAPVDINSPVIATAVIDPPVIEVGEKAVYRVSFNALEAAVRWSQQVSIPPGLKMAPTARGQIMQQAGGVLRPLTAVNFHVVAERAGFYTIPGFEVEVYGKPVSVPATQLEVAPKLEPDHERAREIVLHPARTNVFVGETLRVRVLAPGTMSNVVDGITQLQFNGDGFAEDKSLFRQSVEMLEIHGRRTPAWILESSVTPIAVGTQPLAAQAFTAGRSFSGPVVIAGQATMLGFSQNVLLDSDPVTLNIRPLPPETGTKGFTGFIGNVTLEPPHVSTNSLRVGDAIRLLVTIRGEGRLTRLAPPPAPRVAGWQVFPGMPAEPLPSVVPLTNQRVAFAYTLIPMTEEVRQTPAIPFSVFDPDRGNYVDLTIQPVRVAVSAEGLPTDWKPASWVNEARPDEKPSLSQLAETPGKTVGSLVPFQLRAWFFPVQLAPAFGLFAVWRWDQRRRFLEAHPEVVRRRQARRALRREKRALRQAAASGDAPGFVRRAVTALQIAAAPHFPAEPRALVCGEVLSLFEERECAGQTGEVIRSFFSCVEGASFSLQRESPRPLFALQPELEGILKRMEARL